MKRLILFSVAIVTIISSVALADDIYLGQPIYGGTGCPQGTASAVLSPDQKTLSILFDQFQAEAGYGTGRTVDRKSCNVAVPVHVPQGYSVALFSLDYRGFNSLPAGGASQLSVEYFFAGQKGPMKSRTFSGYQNQDYLVSHQVATGGVIWSACGKDVNFRVNASMMVRTNNRFEQALATVDSTDIEAGLVYHVQWKRCN